MIDREAPQRESTVRTNAAREPEDAHRRARDSACWTRDRDHALTEVHGAQPEAGRRPDLGLGIGSALLRQPLPPQPLDNGFRNTS